MDAYEAIIKNIERFVELTEEERAYFISLLRVTKVRKKQYICQPEFVCRYKSYIFEGAMRSFFVDSNGQEHTIALAIEDWWISDFYSYLYQTPGTLFVEALEESTVLQLEYHAEEQLLERYPRFEKYFRILSIRSLANLQKRMLSNLSLTAVERYDEFLAKYPLIASRVPQYALASYLGITTEFLSKIRSDKRKKS
ncbi:MAG TPA: Crp/Fnr family transcriptional regulator [Puia sp.]|nr:Crp/Fnr family transcriptional regulator [Puia sp.]